MFWREVGDIDGWFWFKGAGVKGLLGRLGV